MRPSLKKVWSAGIQLINFRCHDEIAFRQAIDLVRPESNFDFTPGEQNVGMVPLLFGDLAHFVNEGERLLEVWKRERTGDVVLVDYLPVSPLRHLLMDLFKFFSLERRHAPTAGNTGLGG
jgi:hypothetical protein